jgi:hypothetical protein
MNIDTGFKIRYAANLSIVGNDAVINLTNSGASSALSSSILAQSGNICASVYTYSPDEQLVSCCSCTVTPNGLNSLSVKNDLTSNALTPLVPSAVVVKVLSTLQPTAGCTTTTAATVTRAQLTKGLVAWGTTLHLLTSVGPSTYGVAETEFNNAELSDAELQRMTQLCAFIRANGSGYGICKSCALGGLGAAQR